MHNALKMHENNFTRYIPVKVTLPDERLTLSGGDLPEEYVFAQLHFHWGSTDADGSEHTVDGQEYPLEVRLNPAKSRCTTRPCNGTL